MKSIHIGFVFDRSANKMKAVSVSLKNRQDAGDLMEKWIKDYDPECLDCMPAGVQTVSLSDYINLDDRP